MKFERAFFFLINMQDFNATLPFLTYKFLCIDTKEKIMHFKVLQCRKFVHISQTNHKYVFAHLHYFVEYKIKFWEFDHNFSR